MALSFERKNNQNGCEIKFIEFDVISEYYSVTSNVLSVKTTIAYFSGKPAKIIDITFDEKKGRFTYSTALEITTDVWDNHYGGFTSAMFAAGVRDGVIKKYKKDN